MTLTFVLPFPPSTNNAYANVRGRRVKSKAARAYALEVRQAVAEQFPAHERFEFSDRRLRVNITAHEPDRRRRDIANVEKLATDAVMKQLGTDDRYIDDLRITRGMRSRNGGSITYQIEVLS